MLRGLLSHVSTPDPTGAVLVDDRVDESFEADERSYPPREHLVRVRAGVSGRVGQALELRLGDD